MKIQLTRTLAVLLALALAPALASEREETDAWTAMVSLMLLLPGRLEAQLQRDSGLTLFEYLVLSSLSMAPDRSSGMGAPSSRKTRMNPSGSASASARSRCWRPAATSPRARSAPPAARGSR